MLRVKFERYWNDYHRKNETKSFTDLAELESWIFDQMKQDYIKNKATMSLPTVEPWSIKFCPVYGKEQIWIHQIEAPTRIIFPDSKFTASRRYWNEEIQTWLSHCKERQNSPKFDFAKDEPLFGKLWLRLECTILVSKKKKHLQFLAATMLYR